MTQMQRVFLIIALVSLSILVLFIPLKRNEVEAIETEEEITPIAMLSMERLMAPPRKPVEALKQEASNTPSKETISVLAPTLPVPSEEKTGLKTKTNQSPDQPPLQEKPLEEERQEEIGEDGYYAIDMVTTRPQFNLPLLTSRIVYPRNARRQGKEGTVLLRLFIDEKGNIERIIVEEDPGFGFAEAAIAAFSDFQTTPAIRETSPVPVTLLYPIRFSLQNE